MTRTAVKQTAPARAGAVSFCDNARVKRHSATIVGLGLIGGSIGKALRRAGWRVRFADPHVDVRDAVAAGAADGAALPSDEEAFVIIATPVRAAIDHAHTLRTRALVTSVCSVMAPLRDAFAAPQRAVAGHPFAGSESHGLGSSNEDLFRDRPWFLEDRPQARELEELVSACGADVRYIDADEHDRILALTSHLPQVVATSLASVITAHPEITDDFLGTGLASLLRLSGSTADVWQPVIEANCDAIRTAAAELESAIERVVGGDSAADFTNARATYERLKSRR